MSLWASRCHAHHSALVAGTVKVVSSRSHCLAAHLALRPTQASLVPLRRLVWFRQARRGCTRPLLRGSTMRSRAQIQVVESPHVESSRIQCTALAPSLSWLARAGVFTDPTTGGCSNASDPASLNCAYGAGENCALCPLSALCPGGFRKCEVKRGHADPLGYPCPSY